MGNKADKQISTELTQKRSQFKIAYLKINCILFISEIDLIKANSNMNDQRNF